MHGVADGGGRRHAGVQRGLQGRAQGRSGHSLCRIVLAKKAAMIEAVARAGRRVTARTRVAMHHGFKLKVPGPALKS
jgi:hypothetical protein